MNPIVLINIQPKSRRFRGQVYQPTSTNEHHAEIIPGQSIRIFGLYKNHIKARRNSI